MEVRSSDGNVVVVHDMGGTGAPLLICHATGFCARAYQPFADALAGRHHVYGVDLRGHGDSPPLPDLDFDWMRITHDVLAAVRSISAGPVHVVGHSMGGAVALQAEANFGGVVASAFVFEPIIFPTHLERPAAPNPMASNARRRREAFASRDEVMWRYAKRAPLDELSAASLAAYVEHGFALLDDGSVRLKCRAEWEARIFEASGKITTTTIAGVTSPVVVSVGDETDSFLTTLGPHIVATLERAKLMEIAGVGHFGPLEAPRRFAELVIEAIARAA